MIVLDRMLLGGLRFVLDKVAAVADAELNDEDRLRAQLLDAQQRFEDGELDARELAAIERDVLRRLRAAREARSPGDEADGGLRVTAIEIGDGEEEP
jgi:hypothetical protein